MIHVYEVGLREGSQQLPRSIPTNAKVELIDTFSDAGLPYIEIGSYVSPRMPWYRNVEDTTEVLRQIKKREGTRYSAYVPNFEYFCTAARKDFSDIATGISASNGHNEKNLKKTREKTVEEIRGIDNIAHGFGMRTRIYISTAFGYKSKEDVPLDRLGNIIFELMMTPTTISEGDLCLADTFGYATPESITERIAFARENIPKGKNDNGLLSLHLHESEPEKWKKTVGAGIESGIKGFDSSLLGLGGCPTDESMGNIPTEMLVEHLEKNGHNTGIDSDKVKKAAEYLNDVLRKWVYTD